MTDLLDAKAVAAILGTRLNTVYDLAAKGDLPSYRLRGIGRRFRLEELEAWIEGQRSIEIPKLRPGGQR
jgi:excisionase family DNA binding protein